MTLTRFGTHSLALAIAVSVLAQDPAPKPDSTPQGEPPKPAEPKIELTVNGKILTRAAVDAQMERIMRGSEKIPPHQIGGVRKRERRKILERFTEWALLVCEAERRNLTTPQEEAKELQRAKDSLPPDRTWAQLAEEAPGGEELLRAEVLGNFKVKKLIDTFRTNDVVITQQELDAYRERNKKRLQQPERVTARHILIKVEKDDDESVKAEKKKKLDGIRKQILDGADFGKMAKEHSDCPSKENGGELGMFARGRMAKPFADAAFSQELNEVGPVIETQFGYHIIQVTEKLPAGPMRNEDIKKRLEQQKRQQAVKDLLKELRAKATITYGNSR